MLKHLQLPLAAAYVVVVAVSFATALWLRFDFFLSDFEREFLIVGLAVAVPVKTAIFFAGGLPQGSWRYTGVIDIARICAVNIAASALSAFVILLWFGPTFPRSVYATDFLLCVVLCVSARFAVQLRRGSLSRLFTDIERDPAQESYPQWIASLFLTLTAFLLALSAVLGASVYRLATRSPRLEELSAADRQRLLELASQIVPPVYEPFPLAGPLAFYHMAPNTHYTGVLDDTFTTNDLGFRTVATTPKPTGVKRIVVVGDSWAFGDGVHYEETFARQLETLLNRKGDAWQVYDLAMPGWNTANEIAALHTYFSRLQPDAVVLCPTSNDIDDSYDVWNGRLVLNGFSSGAAFRDSYTYRTRWIKVFQSLQNEVDWLSKQQVPSLIYFLAEWRKLAPYYASLSGLHAPYTVVPTDYLAEKYRLPNEHANPEGHKLIAAYLHNFLLERRVSAGLELLPIKDSVVIPGDKFDEVDVQREFRSYTRYLKRLEQARSSEEFIGKEELFSLDAPAGATTVKVALALIDDAGLYPLTVTAELISDEHTSVVKVFDHFVAGPQVVELPRPASLAGYPVLEVRIAADGAVAGAKLTPISMKRPTVTIR